VTSAKKRLGLALVVATALGCAEQDRTPDETRWVRRFDNGARSLMIVDGDLILRSVGIHRLSRRTGEELWAREHYGQWAKSGDQIYRFFASEPTSTTVDELDATSGAVANRGQWLGDSQYQNLFAVRDDRFAVYGCESRPATTTTTCHLGVQAFDATEPAWELSLQDVQLELFGVELTAEGTFLAITSEPGALSACSRVPGWAHFLETYDADDGTLLNREPLSFGANQVFALDDGGLILSGFGQVGLECSLSIIEYYDGPDRLRWRRVFPDGESASPSRPLAEGGIPIGGLREGHANKGFLSVLSQDDGTTEYTASFFEPIGNVIADGETMYLNSPRRVYALEAP